MTDMQNGSGSARKRRLRIHETTRENDIRYKGPLTYQHFKLMGWLCIVIAQVLVIVRLGARFDPGFAQGSATLQKVLESVANLALPFLLIANFAQILNTEDGYARPLIINGAATAGVCALFYLLFYRYFVGGIEAVLEDPSEALPTVQTALNVFAPYGFFAFNIFLDLFLCTLTMFFLNYRPRRVFTGKAVILFRLLALLPVGYEVGCLVLKLRAARGLIRIPVWAYPLLTVKPVMTFVLFVALALFVKTRELRFRRHGKTHEEYQAFLKTRRNAWNFSVFLAVMLVVVSVVDLAAVLGLSVTEAANTIRLRDELLALQQDSEAASEATVGATQVPGSPRATPGPAGERSAAATAPAEAAQAGPEGAEAAQAGPEGTEAPKAQQDALSEEELLAYLDSGVQLSAAVGFGGSISLILLAPLVLLFCYTRRPKYPKLDLVIPVGGMALILLMYLEGTHQLLGALPIRKINLKEFKNEVLFYISLMMEG